MKTGLQFSSLIDKFRGHKQELMYWQHKYSLVFEKIPRPLIEVHKNGVVYLNAAARRLLNVGKLDRIIKVQDLFEEDFVELMGRAGDIKKIHLKNSEKIFELTLNNKFSNDEYLIELHSDTEVAEEHFPVENDDKLETSAILEEINYSLLSKMREGFVLIDNKGNILFANENYSNMTGYSLEELKTLKFTDITPKKWHSFEKGIIRNLLIKEELFVYEKEYIHKDGYIFPVEIQVSRLERNNKIIGLWGIVRNITQENITKDRLKKSEETYREIFNSSKNLIIVQDLKTKKLIDINQTALDHYGYTRDEMIGMFVGEFSAGGFPYSQKDSDELFERVKKEGQISFLWRDKRKNGELFWTQNFMKIASINGKDHIIVFSTDITVEKEIQDELLQTKQLLETAIKQSPSAIIIQDAVDEKIIYSNLGPSWIPEMAKTDSRKSFFEYLPDIKFFTPGGESISPEDLPLKRAIRKGDIINNFECKAIFNDKVEVWYSANASPIKDISGKIIAGIIIMSDVSEKKKAELEIEESKLLLETVLDTIPARVFWKDKDSVFLGCNKRFLKDAGLENVSQIIGKSDSDLTWKEQAENYKKDDYSVISSGIAKLDYEEPQTTPDGELIWLKTSKIPLKNHRGEIIGMLGTYDEITEFKKNLNELEMHRDHLEMLVAERTEEIGLINHELYNKNEELFTTNKKLIREIDERILIEEMLKQSEETFRSFIEQSDQGICLIDGEGNIIEWNKAMSDLLETTRDKYLNKPIWKIDYDYLPPKDRTNAARLKIQEATLSYIKNPRDIVLVEELKQKINNKLKYIQIRVFPIKTSKGRIFGRINLDITEKKAAEIEIENYKNHLEQLVEERTQALRKGEAHIQLVMQSVPMAFYSFNPINKAETIWYSEQIESLSGYKKEEFIENPDLWESKIHKDDCIAAKRNFNINSPDDNLSAEYRWVNADGKTIWILDQAVLIEATENYPRQVIGCFWDITDRKHSERAIIESERNYREIFNSSTDAIFIHDAHTNKIEDVNDTMLAMYGYNYGEALNINPLKLFSSKPPFDSASALKNINIASAKGMHRFEWLASRRDGTLFWTDIILKSIVLKGEDKLMAVVRDIDEKKRAEQQLKYRTDFEKLIFDISSRFINISNKEVDSNIDAALSEICSFTNADGGYMFRLAEESGEFKVTHLWQNEKMKIDPGKFQKFSNDLAEWHAGKIKNNIVVKVNNIELFPEILPEQRLMYKKQNVYSYVDVPTVYQDNIYGFFGLAANNPDRQWSEDEISLIRATGQIFVNAIKRKESVEALIMSELSHREIYNTTTDAIIVLDLKDGSIVDVNKAMLDMFNSTYQDALETNFIDFMVSYGKYSSGNIRELIDKTINTGPQVFEWHTKKPDGTLFWTEVSLKSAEINGVKSLLSVLRDITERKNAEENLKENEEKYRLLIEGQTDLVIKFNTDGVLLFASPSYCDLFGKREDELIGKNMRPFINPQDYGELNEIWKKLLYPPYTSQAELRGFTKHGWRWLAWNSKAVMDENNQVKEIIAVGRDITYQKGVEDALRQSEDRFRSIVQQLSDIVFILTMDGIIQYDTPSIKKILGYDEGFLIDKSCFDFIHPDDRKTVLEKAKSLTIENQQIVLTEIRMKHSDGRWIPLETVGINMLQHPSIKGLVITCRDISERKLLEKRILDAIIKTEERERERFAKNLHDDLGPLLSSIKMYVNSFSTSEDNKKRNYIIEQLNEVVKEAIVTTKEVSNDLSPHILLNYGLNSAIDLFLKKVPETIHVQFESEFMSERFSNTIENSAYRIVKELVNNSLKHANAGNIHLKLSMNNEFLFLDYNDDGKGFSMNDIDSVHNKGMGLSNINSRVKSLNGNFDIKTKQKNGFSCQIKIPINQSIN
jgi:PAS domain S-box-containing protein